MYTTRDIPAGQELFRYGNPDSVSVYVASAEAKETDPNYEAKLQLNKNFDNYWWGNSNPDHFWLEHGAFGSYDYQPTMGALPNHHCILSSLDAYHHPVVDSHNATSPMAGSFSGSRGRTFYSVRNVKAAEELFLSYGHCGPDVFHENSTSPPWAKFQKLHGDYLQASTLMLDADFDVTVAGLLRKSQNFTEYNERVIDLLPTDDVELEEFLRNVETPERGVSFLARKDLQPRTIDWIKENGICLENIRPEQSTLRDAGRGAFSNIRLQKGEVIVPAPLLHIANRSALDMYSQDGDFLGTQQLLLNYCFGHTESPVLLCPDTNALLINHCSSKPTLNNQNNCKPNAAVRWSGDTISSGWLDRSLSELSKEEDRVLRFDVYATTTIEAGEEIFLDYGAVYEVAWQKHSQSWSSSKKTRDRLSSVDANEMTKIPPQFMNDNLIRDQQYLDEYLFTACQYFVSDMDDDEDYQQKRDWKTWDNETILAKFSDDAEAYKSEFSGRYETHQEFDFWPCTVLRPDKSCDDCYWVRIHQHPFLEDTDWQKNGLPRLLSEYPRNLIRYFIRPGANDQYQTNAFRHHIEIPNELLPVQWKVSREDL